MRVTLRPASPDDRPFFFELYASTRAAELELVPWSAKQKHAFLSMQFEAQTRHYSTQYQPPASFEVVLADGAPAGRLVVHRGEDLHVVDIVVHPSFRGRGLGTQVLGGLIDEAEAKGQRVSIYVEFNNPALRLYERLGFVKVGEQGIAWRMHREPKVQPKTTS